MPRSTDLEYMARAARLALRGHGGAEPNPMVGCVIVAPDGAIVGTGYHRRCGGPHAEINALRAAGAAARGATAFVTLEPCNHHGRTGPCSRALVEAGVARVCIGRLDPHPDAGGGLRALDAAGIVTAVVPERSAVRVSEPFVHTVDTGLPWIIAKWAQTIDGRIATRTGASKWISGERSRSMVHRERGRVDAILTGIGTVLADDPMLTARCRIPRRTPRRVVLDPDLQTPLDAALVRTAHEVPTTLLVDEAVAASADRTAAHRDAGVDLHPLAAAGGGPLAATLRSLAGRHRLATVFVEAGAGLLGRLFAEDLVNEAWVFVAPLLLGDIDAVSCVRGLDAPALTDGTSFELLGVHRRNGDVLLRYLRADARHPRPEAAGT
ncbi:MAG: bifunctional diaminohydroxyphosphoribosylaminopyrimidine deaminase/5-amino-6-(5-phosphoribosylamino)uracil reductase RibD [Planctomycetota bacterium]|jgi:diaminohydroxyphosphoribosylaminopyrimidine deaminase/5-amino-6-(5-phosphoribosylamino)uracil reductase